VEAVEEMLSSHEALLAKLRKNLHKSQKHMKKLANTHRRDVQFEVGTWVYVRLRLYRQTS